MCSLVPTPKIERIAKGTQLGPQGQGVPDHRLDHQTIFFLLKKLFTLGEIL